MAKLDRAQRVEELFQAALALEPAARRALLDATLGDDAGMRAEVESLLAHHDASSRFLARPAVQAELEVHRSRPERIGSYRVLDLLGAGGMGVVYLAEQEHPRRTVALKVIRPGLASAHALRRFEHEAQVLARLQHPGIAQIFEAGAADYGAGVQPYFAMEYVRGPTLAAHVAAAKLGTRERLALLAQVCDALEHAHQRGVIHRDLKPSNVLVEESAGTAQVKVLDFGIARVADADVQSTAMRTDVGQVIGTVPYMSPEQAGGDSSAVDQRSDVYALGVIGYELVCGRLPLDVVGKPLHEAVRIVREDEPTPLSKVQPLLRGDVETIFAKALEKDRERRYGSAGELAADLRRYLSDRPIVARPASRAYVLAKFARRNQTLVGGVAAVFAALLVGLGATLRQARVAAAERDRADEEAQRAGAERDRANAEAAQAVAQRNRADQEARRATAVARYQREMLARVRPERDGRDVRLADVLDSAAAALPGEFAGSPDLEGAARQMLGASYVALGLLERAEAQFQAALPLYQQALGPTSLDTLELQGWLAGAIADRGRTEEALALAQTSYDGLREQFGREHPATLVAELKLAELYDKLGRGGEAEQMARENLELRSRVFGDGDVRIVGAYGTLGRLLWKQGRLDEAEPLLREAFEKSRVLAGEEHPDTLVRASLLAGVLRHQGQLDEAEELYRRALETGVTVLGGDHYDVLTWKNNLAALLQQRGRSPEAESLLREVIDTRMQLFGEEHEDTLIAMNNLGLCYSNAGRYAEAEALHRRALAIKRRVFGDDHRTTLSSLHNLALVLLLQGDPASALALFGECAERAPTALPAGHWQIAAYRESYGACLQKLGRLDEAERELDLALGAMRTSFDDGDSRVRSIAERLRGLYQARGEHERAAAIEAQFAAKSP